LVVFTRLDCSDEANKKSGVMFPGIIAGMILCLSCRNITIFTDKSGRKNCMLNKEGILAYVQQGQTLPGWQILRPRMGYLARLAIIYAFVAVAVLAFGVYFISQTSFVIVWYAGMGLSDQTWRYIDEALLAILFVVFAGGALKYMLDINMSHTHVLVLMPDGFLLKKGETEQLVAYSGVTSISSVADRYGNVRLNIKAVGTNVLYKVRFDNRYGKSRVVASQIVAAQRQYAASQKSAAK
jgi:hypothetical protein